MVCDYLGKVTPCFFNFKNTKNFFYFFHFFSKKKAFKKIIFFIFNFWKIYTEYNANRYQLDIPSI